MNILSLLVIAVLAEAVWETLKMVWDKGKVSIDRIGAIVIGLLIALGTGFDILKIMDVSINIPYIGMILTGILISRGANFVHDLLGKVNNVYQNSKSTAVTPPTVINPGGTITNTDKL